MIGDLLSEDDTAYDLIQRKWCDVCNYDQEHRHDESGRIALPCDKTCTNTMLHRHVNPTFLYYAKEA